MTPAPAGRSGILMSLSASLPAASAARTLAGLPAWMGAGAYFAAVALLQWAVSSTAELDQAEQLVLAQSLAWGYTNQPPLYTWLVWAVFQLTGPSLLALSALKVALLTGLVTACMALCRELGGQDAQARLAGWGLLLLPPVVWEAQRDLTHSLLAATLGAALCGWTVRTLRRSGGCWAYAGAGLLAGLAVLAKHNAAVLVLALLLALCLTPPWRARLRWRGVLLAAGVAAAVVAPHAVWLATHADVLQHTLDKLGDPSRGDAVPPLGALAAAMALGLLGFAGPWALMAPLLLGRRPAAAQASGGAAPPGPPADPLPPGRVLACALVLMAALAAALGGDSFKGRWFMPVFFLLPVWLALRTGPRPPWRPRLYIGAGAVLAGACGLMLVLQVLRPLPGQPEVRRNLPLVELGRLLPQATGEPPSVVLAPHHLLAGNLRLALPQAEVRAASLRLGAPPPRPAGRVLVVVPPGELGDESFAAWLAQQTGRRPQDIRWQGMVEHPLLHRPQAPAFRLLWAVVAVDEDGPAP